MKRSRLIIAKIILLLILIAAPKLFFVPYLTKGLEKEIKASLQAKDVQVNLRAPLGWEVILGRLPSFDLVAWDAIIDDLSVSKLELQGKKIRFDAEYFWKNRQFIYTEADFLVGSLVVTEDAINEKLWQEIDPEKYLRLQISPEGVDLKGTMVFWNIEWSITLRGELSLQSGSTLRYRLKDFEVQETSLPSLLLESLGEQYEFSIDFSVLPYSMEVEITDVIPEMQQIVVMFGGI